MDAEKPGCSKAAFTVGNPPPKSGKNRRLKKKIKNLKDKHLKTYGPDGVQWQNEMKRKLQDQKKEIEWQKASITRHQGTIANLTEVVKKQKLQPDIEMKKWKKEKEEWEKQRKQWEVERKEWEKERKEWERERKGLHAVIRELQAWRK